MINSVFALAVRILLGFLIAFGSEAVVWGQQPEVEPPPGIRSISKWVSQKSVPGDCSDYGLLDVQTDLGSLWAISVTGGTRKRLGALKSPTRVPRSYVYDSGIAVFAMKGNWALVHEDKGDWYWVLLEKPDPPSTGSNPSADDPWTAFFNTSPKYRDGEGPSHPSPDLDGWIVYREIETIEPMPGELLRALPSLKSKGLGKVANGYLKIIKFQGDWVQVEEALEVQSIPGGEDHSDLLKVRWDSKRIGWIRWRVPGPKPGIWRNRLRGTEYFGIID